MRKRRYIWLIIVLGFLHVNLYAQAPIQQNVLAQTLSKADLFLADIEPEQREDAYKNLSQLIESLEVIREKESDDDVFLRKVFLKTNRKVLRRYSLFSDFSETLSTGNYGCLSGTILYSLVLFHFNFDFTAIELSDHVYLLVENGESKFIFESTLGSRGFIANKQDIENALSGYSERSMINQSMAAVASYRSSEQASSINNRIGLRELAGLQLYNKAIENFKNTELILSLEYAEASHELYPSVRIKQLMQLLVNEILYSEGLTKEVKENALKNYISHVRENKISQTK
ncbi:hypothetical protein OB69_11845 [Roseivirga seohaensis subsp. aquiponti]|uniref:Protein SirB1 N-terminal domain-containing protein n=1 Tax=Roseivirga seohaensis subsp. aquiponti TaxID=1566026 RepID=A0A0L8AJV6_9BACT|nr:hypothetical protein [Roseivirga seohaensis]KOF02465.1 hypothetical protein OB69_11845 [Roseivirga seohaensis subsp. aquiponti]